MASTGDEEEDGEAKVGRRKRSAPSEQVSFNKCEAAKTDDFPIRQ